MSDEKFSLVKMVSSPFTGLFWVKSIMYGLGIGCLAFIGYGVYKAYFKKPEPTTTQNQNAEKIENVSYQTPRVMFGCQRFTVKPEDKK